MTNTFTQTESTNNVLSVNHQSQTLRKSLSEKDWEQIEFDLSTSKDEWNNIEPPICHDFLLLKAIFIKYAKKRCDMKFNWERNLELYLCRAVDQKKFTDISKMFGISHSSARSVYNKARRIIIESTMLYTMSSAYESVMKRGIKYISDNRKTEYLNIYQEFFGICRKDFAKMYNIPELLVSLIDREQKCLQDSIEKFSKSLQEESVLNDNISFLQGALNILKKTNDGTISENEINDIQTSIDNFQPENFDEIFQIINDKQKILLAKSLRQYGTTFPNTNESISFKQFKESFISIGGDNRDFRKS